MEVRALARRDRAGARRLAPQPALLPGPPSPAHRHSLRATRPQSPPGRMPGAPAGRTPRAPAHEKWAQPAPHRLRPPGFHFTGAGRRHPATKTWHARPRTQDPAVRAGGHRQAVDRPGSLTAREPTRGRSPPAWYPASARSASASSKEYREPSPYASTQPAAWCNHPEW